jgi:hypothetical protein
MSPEASPAESSNGMGGISLNISQCATGIPACALRDP